MIINRVSITDYKQYVGEQTIEIPSLGTIGVIGANGVGKTTLFEAIEWCLYCPSTIRNQDIRPRGRASTPKVSIVFEQAESCEQFVVERTLRKASTAAAVYRVESDGEETMLVQGTKPVTDYVASTLIGLSHDAFVHTFFTRQKELSFFGELGDSARRRAVGKLLGLETIRRAQERIAEDRTKARNTAQVLAKQYETESEGRDFAAELKAADETIAVHTRELDQSRREEADAKERAEATEQRLHGLQQLKDQDAGIASELATIAGNRSATTGRIATIDDELARLDRRERDRVTQARLAEPFEALQAQVEAMDAERSRYLQRQELLRSIQSNERRRDDAIAAIRSQVAANAAPDGREDWSWSNEDSGDPSGTLIRLTAVCSSIDISGLESRLQATREATRLVAEIAAAEATLCRYKQIRSKLDTQLQHLSDDFPDIEGAIVTVTGRMSDSQKAQAEAQATIRAIEADQTKTRRIRDNLRNQRLDDACPTCGRPFTHDDLQHTIDVFSARLSGLHQEISSAREQHDHASRCFTQCLAQVKELEMRRDEITKCRARIKASEEPLHTQAKFVDGIREKFSAALATLGVTEAPGEDQEQQLSIEIQQWRRIIDLAQPIKRTSESLSRLSDEILELERQVDQLGTVAYDEVEHRAATARREGAIKAQTAIIEIDRELARRPTLLAEKSQQAACVEELTASERDAQSRRTALGFHPDDLATASTAFRDARDARDAAIERTHRISIELSRATNGKSTLEAEQQRIERLAKQADEEQRKHTELDRMYREFDEFERYAAAWYAPQLSDMTSRLVSDVTDGKYGRVEFDKNFGVDVFDGDEEKFPIESFSGGERDVIALCARIALSRVIGGQGTNPPSFLVLDEVFGSLDRDRRSRLLELLGTLGASGDSLQQVFMISHVDDVRTAPVFDEIWHITESEDGVSTLAALPAGADIGEL